ncbi:TetR/AcrR family transcriptional regulator [Nocardia sp. CWNU-33]|uniref:TetR/AcrR family transcriptional regulator n=1 Tax=Nocardia sp. CWNU-33 TaxID=3392117 RepID=UPI00398F0BD8
MADKTQARRTPLSRDRVLRAAVALADDVGIDSLSMRTLAQELGVVPMALYKHVSNKEELLGGMVDVIVGEIGSPEPAVDWKSAVRQRILAARRALLRHSWASRVIESRATPTPTVMAYMDSMIGMFLAGGLSVDLTHHVMHALGSRIFGFSQELFDAPRDLDPQRPALGEMTTRYPHIMQIASANHDRHSVVGSGCDDQFEFEFALDLLLDGFERLWRLGWSSTGHRADRL